MAPAEKAVTILSSFHVLSLMLARFQVDVIPFRTGAHSVKGLGTLVRTARLARMEPSPSGLFLDPCS